MADYEFQTLAEALVVVARDAGRAIMGHYRRGVAVETKADASPVTAADREAEDIILAGLCRCAPDVPVVAEESMAAGARARIGDRFFLVDPLDGTREFINRRDEFTVNIALVESGRPVFGLVYAPAAGRMYVTLGRAQAVSLRVDPDRAETIALTGPDVRPLATRPASGGRLTILASRSHLDDGTRQFLSFYPDVELRSAGSSLKFCVVAAGEADIYPRLGPTMEWDTAAGHAVVTAAGGRVTTADGNDLAYGKVETGFLNPGFVVWADVSLVRPY